MLHDQAPPIEAYSIRRDIIEYAAFCAAMDRIGRLHQRAKLSGQPGGLLITGLSGSGKTTIKQEYRNRFPTKDAGDVTHVPVLTVETPATPTVKSLAEYLLIALGDPFSHRGSTEQKTLRIYHYLRLCKVELILIDEFQHFVHHGAKNQIQQVTDWLKNLIDKAAIPVVLLGLPACESVLKLNVQLARRFSARHDLKVFGFSDEKEQQEFCALLQAIQQALPMRSVCLYKPDMAMRFYVATYGLIDYVCKITDAAVQIAAQRNAHEIGRDIYAEAFVEEVWKDAPESRNPFVQRTELRPLIKPGEPFFNWAQGIGGFTADLTKKRGQN
jgi:DNA transposition AAA+ family ATPase